MSCDSPASTNCSRFSSPSYHISKLLVPALTNPPAAIIASFLSIVIGTITEHAANPSGGERKFFTLSSWPFCFLAFARRHRRDPKSQKKNSNYKKQGILQDTYYSSILNAFDGQAATVFLIWSSGAPS